MTTLWTEITWLLKISCVALIGLGYEWKWIFPLATHGSYPGRKRISAHRTPASLIIMHTGSQVTQLQLPLSHCWLSDCFYLLSASESVEGQQYCELVGRVMWREIVSESYWFCMMSSKLCVHGQWPLPGCSGDATFWNLHPSPWELQIELTGIRFCLEPRVKGRPNGSGDLGCEKHMQTLYLNWTPTLDTGGMETWWTSSWKSDNSKDLKNQWEWLGLQAQQVEILKLATHAPGDLW